MQDIKKARIIIGLLFILIAALMPHSFMQFDLEHWLKWALLIHRDGLTNIYNHRVADYQPLYYYFLWFFDWIQGSKPNIVENIGYIKLLPLCFDFLPVIVLCCFRQTIINTKIPYLYLLLNIAYLFNTCIWGQIDSIYTCLCFFAILYGARKPVLSAFLFAFALALKPQPIIFLPIMGVIWLYGVRNFKTILVMLFTIAITWLVIALPFIVAGKGQDVWNVVVGAVGRFPRVSLGAFNIWYLITKDNPYHTLDKTTYFILSYKQWGLIFFLISSGLVMLTVLFRFIRARIEKEHLSQDMIKMLMLTAGIITLYFFYFNTQMHERYAHATLLFFFFYGVLQKDYKLYILASIPYFLSLDKLMPDYLPVTHYKIIWASQVIALWYTLELIYSSYLFFSQYKLKQEYQKLKAALALNNRLPGKAE
jgi:Predicted integral membrane protein